MTEMVREGGCSVTEMVALDVKSVALCVYKNLVRKSVFEGKTVPFGHLA